MATATYTASASASASAPTTVQMFDVNANTIFDYSEENETLIKAILLYLTKDYVQCLKNEGDYLKTSENRHDFMEKIVDFFRSIEDWVANPVCLAKSLLKSFGKSISIECEKKDVSTFNCLTRKGAITEFSEEEIDDLLFEKITFNRYFDCGEITKKFHELLRGRYHNDAQAILLAVYMTETNENVPQSTPTTTANSKKEEKKVTMESFWDMDCRHTSDEEDDANDYSQQPSLYVCDHCNMQWDGFAQCQCGWQHDWFQQPPLSPLPQMKSKSKSKKHPGEWSSAYHYGQCGQSCPCCRARNNEFFGACTICKH